jgi:hypothetical protein
MLKGLLRARDCCYHSESFSLITHPRGANLQSFWRPLIVGARPAPWLPRWRQQRAQRGIQAAKQWRGAGRRATKTMSDDEARLRQQLRDAEAAGADTTSILCDLASLKLDQASG